MTMITEQTATNIAAVRRFWEGFNMHNLTIWDEVCAPILSITIRGCPHRMLI